jgi:hypothetical protein
MFQPQLRKFQEILGWEWTRNSTYPSKNSTIANLLCCAAQIREVSRQYQMRALRNQTADRNINLITTVESSQDG